MAFKQGDKVIWITRNFQTRKFLGFVEVEHVGTRALFAGTFSGITEKPPILVPLDQIEDWTKLVIGQDGTFISIQPVYATVDVYRDYSDVCDVLTDTSVSGHPARWGAYVKDLVKLP